MSRTFACDGSHDHSQTFDLKATQHYPRAFAECTTARMNSQAGRRSLKSFAEGSFRIAVAPGRAD